MPCDPLRDQEGMLSLRSHLVDARGMLFFMVEQVFLQVGEVWSMHNADTQCKVGGERRSKGRDFFVNIFLVLS